MDAPDPDEPTSAPPERSQPRAVFPPATVLAYAQTHQEHLHWCWAAIALSVANYFDAENAWTQRTIVDETLKRTAGSDDGDLAACDRPFYIYEALDVVGHYAQRKASGNQPYETVKEEIASGRPLCVLIKWNEVSGHFVVVHGYDDDGEMLYVADPRYGDAVLPYEAFPGRYKWGGSWAWSYWTTRGQPADLTPPEGSCTDDAGAAD